MQEITGDAILDGDGQIEIQMPDHWTGEWVCERMIRAFETLRVVSPRIGPKAFGTCWAEYALDYKEVRLRPRAGFGEVECMEEALAWPATYLNGEDLAHMLARDAVLLWTSVKASGGDVQPILRQRYLQAAERAALMTKEENRRRANSREQITREVQEWAQSEQARLEKNWAPSERQEMLHRLENRAYARLQDKLKAFADVRLLPKDGANGRVINDRTLRSFRLKGFDVIARGLARDQVQIR